MDMHNDSTSRTIGNQESWVIIAAGESLYAVPSLSVRTMVMMPPVASVPNTPGHVRGVINLRGRVLPLVDLRMRCGVESLAEHVESICKLLEQREEDHRNWLAELEKSVNEQRDFKLTTDPHKCAFGKWYDQFHTEDLVLAGIMKTFDEPHKAIHGVAHQVEDAKQRKDFQGAAALIEQTRKTVLAQLLNSFAASRSHMRSATREIALVLEDTEGAGKSFALAVDKVESTELLSAESVTSLPRIMASTTTRFILGVAKRKRDKRMILLLDVRPLYEDTMAVDAA